METRLIRPIVRIGNSAGVILPRKWLNKQATVQLTSLDIKTIEKKVIEILIDENILQKVLGIYLIGSYARNEQTEESDIDVLIITSNINKIIKKERYQITLISKSNVEKQLEINILPILPWLIEAKTIINKELIESYKNTPLTRKNLKWHIETTKSAMNVVKEDIKICEEFSEIKMMDSSAYSLILRLRTLYIIECLRKRKLWKKKDFLELVKTISGDLNAYKIYNDVKNEEKSKLNLSTIEARKLMNYINKRIVDIEKWIKEKKD